MPSDLHAVLPPAVRAGLEARAASGALELPVFSTTASRVLELGQSEGCDVARVAALIERDQALAAHVLHTANSAAFAPREPIVSLPQAVSRLGLETLCEVTVAVVLRGNVFHAPGFEATIAELWRHSAATGAFAREIARALRRNVEGAFLCGLLHDVGKPIALHLLTDVCEEAGVPLDQELAEATMEHFHPILGGMLVRDWGLAPWIEEAAEHHHDYARAEEFRVEAMVTCLADQMAHWAVGTQDVSEEDLAGLRVLADLDLYDDDLRRVMAARDRALRLAEAFA